MGCTQDLVDAVSGTTRKDLPDDVIATAKACLLDMLGVTLAGCRHPLVQILDEVVAGFGSATQATVIGRRCKASVPDAALINGAAAHALDFDDMHIASAMHPSGPVIAAALATAEYCERSGSDFLRAVALGLEVATRLGETVNPSHYERGWHATGTLGHFGAVTAASALRGLTATQMTAALGIAGTQAAGLKEVFGSMSKPLHAGHAARNGVMAAWLAARGFTSTGQILEGVRGFGQVMSENVAWPRLLDEWGVRWSLRKILYKPHASAFCSQALIEGVLGLRGKYQLTDRDVRAIRVAVSRESIENARIGEPASGLEGKFSLTHAAAQALAYGQATEMDFTDGRVAEPRLREIRKRVVVAMEKTLGWPEAIVEIDTMDGRTLREAVDLQDRTASAEQKWTVVQAKFRRLAAELLPTARSEALIRAVGALDDASNIGELITLAEWVE